MTFTDVGDPLPEGLSYDVSEYPEKIESAHRPKTATLR